MDGLIRTKDDIVKSQVTDLFKATNLQDVIIRSYKVREKLDALGCFRHVGVYIDTSQGPEATPEGVEVGLYNYTLIHQRISNFSNLETVVFHFYKLCMRYTYLYLSVMFIDYIYH